LRRAPDEVQKLYRLHENATSFSWAQFAPRKRRKPCARIKGLNRRVVLQGVYMLMRTDTGAPWEKNEAWERRIVFIGRQLPRALIEQGFAQTLAPER